MDAHARQVPVLPRPGERSCAAASSAPQVGYGTSILSLSDYDLKEKVGQGAQGSVYRAIRRSTGECVALKQIDVAYMSERERNNALAEVKVLATIAEDPHPCVTSYQESFVAEGSLWIALEWSANGTLQDALNRVQRKERGEFDEDEVWHIFLSIALALDHVHQMHILHRDVKMANVFLHYPESSNSRASNGGFGLPRTQLGDFGVSTILDDRSRAHTMVGTPYYLSPELCLGKPYSSKSDVWSLGVILYVLLNQKMPYEASNYAALILRIVQQDHAKHHPASSRYSATLRNMTTWCLQKDEAQRPTASDLLMHPDCLRQVVRLALPASASLLARASVVPFGLAPLRRSKAVRQENASPTDALQPPPGSTAAVSGRPLPPRRQPLSSLASAAPVGVAAAGKPITRRKQRVITGASNPTARAAVMATQQSPLLAAAPGSRGSIPASKRQGSAQPKPISVLQAMGAAPSLVPPAALGGQSTAGRPTSATSPLTGAAVGPSPPRSTVLKRASDVAAVHRLPNIGDEAGGSSEEDLPRGRAGRPPSTTEGGSPDGRRRVYSYEKRMLREDPERCMRLLGASQGSMSGAGGDGAIGLWISPAEGVTGAAGSGVNQAGQRPRRAVRGEKLASHDRYLDHVHSWREEDRPSTRGATSCSTETIALLRKHNLAPSAMLEQIMQEDDVADDDAVRCSRDETVVVVNTRQGGIAVARTWGESIECHVRASRGGGEAAPQFVFAQHSLTATMAELDVTSAEALSRVSLQSTIPDESSQIACDATTHSLLSPPVRHRAEPPLELYDVEEEDKNADDANEEEEEARRHDASMGRQQGEFEDTSSPLADSDEDEGDYGYGEAESYATAAGQSPPAAGFGEVFEDDDDDDGDDDAAGDKMAESGGVGAVSVFWRVDEDSGTSGMVRNTTASKRSTQPATNGAVQKSGVAVASASAPDCQRKETDDTPTETFGNSALLLERVGELFHAGEALVGERGFAEVIELLTRDTSVSSSELQEFVASRTRTPHEASELLYVSFRFVMLNGELLKLRREKRLHVARESYVA